MIELFFDRSTRPARATIARAAVKAVVRRGDRVLLLRSAPWGDYKFPGGGVEEDEDDHACLRREMLEECGRTITAIGEPVVRVVERHDAREPHAIFEMTSTYYALTVGADSGERELDDYERDLTLTACWVRADEAIAANRVALDKDGHPTWIEREIAVLEYIAGATGTQ